MKQVLVDTALKRHVNPTGVLIEEKENRRPLKRLVILIRIFMLVPQHTLLCFAVDISSEKYEKRYVAEPGCDFPAINRHDRTAAENVRVPSRSFDVAEGTQPARYMPAHSRQGT